MKTNYVVLFVLVIGIIVASGCIDQKSDSDNANITGVSAPRLPPSPSTEVKLSPLIENNCVGFLTGSPDETGNIKIIGAGWARPHPGPFSWGYIETAKGHYDFSATDRYVAEAQKNGIAILATIWPFADWDQGNSCQVSREDIFYPRGFGDGIPSHRCKPKDMNTYVKFLANLIERYDGDGADDMTGLKTPIKYWEILNEPEMKSPPLTFFNGDENDYFEILKESYMAIKKTCSDCKVLHGGAAGAQTEFLSFWENVFKLGGGDYFDIANIHFINSGDVSSLNVRDFKSLLGKYRIQKPVWVTEAEFGSSQDDVKAAAEGALNAGAGKIFFVSFKVGGHSPSATGDFASVYKEVVEICPKA